MYSPLELVEVGGRPLGQLDARRRPAADAPAGAAPERRPADDDARGLDDVARRQDHRALDQVAQLAHVAGVVVGDAGCARSRARSARAGLRMRAAKTRQEVRRERQDVLAPVAQRRHADVEHVEPVVEVEAEGAALDLVGEILVGRGDDAARSTVRSRVPPRRRKVISSSTLSSLACVPAGISPISSRKSVPPSASSKRPRFVRLGVGEGAALVAEQLALEQALGHRRAVDLDERPVARARACGGG